MKFNLAKEKAMKSQDKAENRILARNLARELTLEETLLVAGQSASPNMIPKQTSTCSASDNSSCDLDNYVSTH